MLVSHYSSFLNKMYGISLEGVMYILVNSTHKRWGEISSTMCCYGTIIILHLGSPNSNYSIR